MSHSQSRRRSGRSARAPSPPQASQASPASQASQGSQSPHQSEPSRNLSLTEEDVSRLVSLGVFYILSNERKRSAIKKGDLFRALGLTGKGRDIQERIFEKVGLQLLQVFGLRLVPVEGDAYKKGLFVLNELQDHWQVQHLTWPDSDHARMGLLTIVLAVIFMNNGVMVDTDLFRFLKKLGVLEDPEDRGSCTANPQVRRLFGDVKTLIFREWGQKQQYLQIKKVDTGETDNPRSEIRWGPRASLEAKESAILTVVSKIYGVEPTAFRKEYDQIVAKEGAQAFADTTVDK